MGFICCNLAAQDKRTDKMSIFYRAFGLLIDSEIPIGMLLPVPEGTADVTVRRADLSGKQKEYRTPEEYFFRTQDSAFCIRGGREILVDSGPEAPEGLLSVYLLGSCMGAVLHQRKLFLLHGSCVTKDGCSVLLTGDSGAGKSTLAAEFLNRGWQLVTDDVAVITGIESGCPMVQTSYPSQKLWRDAIERTNYQGELLPLYQEQRREKFNIRVESFREGTYPLKAVVRLIPAGDCCVEPVDGFAKVDQLMRNTYRPFMIAEGDRQQHFQRCVTLSGQIAMLVALRSTQRDTAGEVYEQIVQYLER